MRRSAKSQRGAERRKEAGSLLQAVVPDSAPVSPQQGKVREQAIQAGIINPAVIGCDYYTEPEGCTHEINIP